MLHGLSTHEGLSRCLRDHRTSHEGVLHGLMQKHADIHMTGLLHTMMTRVLESAYLVKGSVHQHNHMVK